MRDGPARYADLVEGCAAWPDVGIPDPTLRGFGAAALKVAGKIFAMLADDQLVLKLPATRVRDLITAGTGAPFDAGKGRPMREWLTVLDPDHDLPLAREAYEFVYASARSASKPAAVGEKPQASR